MLEEFMEDLAFRRYQLQMLFLIKKIEQYNKDLFKNIEYPYCNMFYQRNLDLILEIESNLDASRRVINLTDNLIQQIKE